MDRPGKVICVGRNYREHAKELGNEVPSTPLVFVKPINAVIEDRDPIVLPAGVGRVDFEGEIGVVIGRRIRKASEEEAADAVRGIVAVNDVSARDLQKSDPQWWRAKGYDTFCPIGPEGRGIPEFDALEVITRVNGTVRQRGLSKDMAFRIPFLLSFISGAMTLEPGDVVATGTPEGVGPLAPGDLVEVEVPGWSVVRSPVVADA
jgi:2-keto-4-pentenoate hydratase/2-oxohepta-3-ene-1,7-dioic acid hydratase in catechol pathway